jgi:uncharacterized membrane protein
MTWNKGNLFGLWLVFIILEIIAISIVFVIPMYYLNTTYYGKDTITSL